MMRRLRGFTLIELMVALTGGLFFSIFVFALTRDVTRFFQRESRLSDATMSAITGFDRLRNDVARGGFLASPNLMKDPRRCPAPDNGVNAGASFDATWTTMTKLKEMAALQVQADSTLSSNTFLSSNSLVPDEITLFGSYSASEQFPIQTITPGSSPVIYLDTQSGALVRSGVRLPLTGYTTENGALLAQLFPAGRPLRLLNAEGEQQYGIIASTTASATSLIITLAANPALITKSASTTCGLRGLAGGMTVNTVNIVHYSIVDLRTALGGANAKNDAQFGYLFSGEAPGASAEQRLELVRSELSAAGAVIAGSQEVVAEYAVNLGVGLSVVTSPLTSATAYYPPTDATNRPAYGGPTTAAVSLATTKGAHFIRAAQLSLSVRVIEGDREANVAAADVGSLPFRVKLNDGRYARVRSLQATVATRNTRDMLWN